jgi:hypothetical protein
MSMEAVSFHSVETRGRETPADRYLAAGACLRHSERDTPSLVAYYASRLCSDTCLKGHR